MLHIHPTHTPLEDASAQLNTLLRDARGKEILLLLSGGSALSLVDRIDVSLLGTHVTISVLDERWTYEAKDSNFAQLTTLPFLHKALDAGVTCIDPRPHEPEDLYDTAKRFDLALKHWHVTHRDGVTIATMGIGADGHTAGILPMPEDPETFKTLFEHTTTCVRGYTVSHEQNPHTKRMTVTLTYLRRHVDHVVLYVVNIEKRNALLTVLNGPHDTATCPGQIVHTLQNGNLYTNVDCA